MVEIVTVVGVVEIMTIGSGVGVMEMDTVVTNLFIPNPMVMRNRFMSRLLYAIYLSHRPASI